MCREDSMVKVRLVHHDFPENLRSQIKEKFGESSVNVSELSDGIVEIQFDEREEPWKHPGAIGRAIQDLMDHNEWIRYEEPK